MFLKEIGIWGRGGGVVGTGGGRGGLVHREAVVLSVSVNRCLLPSRSQSGVRAPADAGPAGSISGCAERRVRQMWH